MGGGGKTKTTHDEGKPASGGQSLDPVGWINNRTDDLGRECGEDANSHEWLSRHPIESGGLRCCACSLEGTALLYTRPALSGVRYLLQTQVLPRPWISGDFACSPAVQAKPEGERTTQVNSGARQSASVSERQVRKRLSMTEQRPLPACRRHQWNAANQPGYSTRLRGWFPKDTFACAPEWLRDDHPRAG